MKVPPRSFDRNSTSDQVLEGIDLTGRLVLVTGMSSGLGAETARALASRGARVVGTGRDVAKAEGVAAEIRSQTGNAAVEVMELHLDRPASVRAFAGAFVARHKTLHVLVANAGVMACPLTRTAEGRELQFAANHLGHFLLAALLWPALRAGAPARVVVVSSAAHLRSGVDFDDIHFERRPYDKWVAYGQAKTANVLFARELDRRSAPAGVRALALHPGMIFTELGRHLTEEDVTALTSEIVERSGSFTLKSVQQGAATQLFAATAPELEGKGGLYLEDVQVSGSTPCPGGLGCAPHALDGEAAARLWQVSETALDQRFAP